MPRRRRARKRDRPGVIAVDGACFADIWALDGPGLAEVLYVLLQDGRELLQHCVAGVMPSTVAAGMPSRRSVAGSGTTLPSVR